MRSREASRSCCLPSLPRHPRPGKAQRQDFTQAAAEAQVARRREADGAVPHDLRGFGFSKKQRKGADSRHNQPPPGLMSFTYLRTPLSCQGPAHLGKASEVPQAPPSGRHRPGIYPTLGRAPVSTHPPLFYSQGQSNEFECLVLRPRPSFTALNRTPSGFSNTRQTQNTNLPAALGVLTCQPLRSAFGCRRGRTCASRAVPGGLGSPHRMAANTQSAGHAPAGVSGSGGRARGEHRPRGERWARGSLSLGQNHFSFVYQTALRGEHEPLLNIKCSKPSKNQANFAKKVTG